MNENISDFVISNTAFAFDLYAQLKTKEGNLFFSPYSISTALAMIYAGARENTAAQMAEVLHFELEPEFLYQAFAELEAHLRMIQERGHIQLNVANALWAQAGYRFLEGFLKLVIEHYKATLNSADFETACEEARQAINAWVEHQTQGKIQELIAPGILTSLTRLVLVNAIYFKGNWASQFTQESTHDAAFWVTPDTSIDVPMMTQKQEFKHALISEDQLQIIELPYVGEELSMIVLLPVEKDGLTRIEDLLSVENLEFWLEHLYPLKIDVYLPKFKLLSDFQLHNPEILPRMGMTDAFDDNADFSGMDGTKGLYISAILHKAFVDVNEEGTEAAAATAVVMSLRGFAAPPPQFRADHPFLFLIREKASGSVLFLGRVVDPTQA